MGLNLKCPKCDSRNTVAFVTYAFTIPSGLNRNMTKTKLRNAKIRMTAQIGDTNYFCESCNSTFT